MNHILRLTFAVLVSAAFLMSPVTYSAGDKDNFTITGTVSRVSASSGIIEVKGKKFRFRYSSVVLDENGKKMPKEKVQDIPKGTLVLIHARKGDPHPIVISIQPQLT